MSRNSCAWDRWLRSFLVIRRGGTKLSHQRAANPQLPAGDSPRGAITLQKIHFLKKFPAKNLKFLKFPAKTSLYYYIFLITRKIQRYSALLEPKLSRTWAARRAAAAGGAGGCRCSPGPPSCGPASRPRLPGKRVARRQRIEGAGLRRRSPPPSPRRVAQAHLAEVKLRAARVRPD